jgi:hypothetical protein
MSSSNGSANGSSSSPLHRLHSNGLGQQQKFAGGNAHSSSAGEHPLQMSNPEPNQYNNLDYFELNGKLGKGQFSEVLRGRNKLTGKAVALKKIEASDMGNVAHQIGKIIWRKTHID